MYDINGKIDQARQAGFSDQEILGYIQKAGPNYYNDAKNYIGANPAKQNTDLTISNAKEMSVTNNAINSGADPQDLAWAKSRLGSDDYINYCEQFVENASGETGKSASAFDAWQTAQNKVEGLHGIKPGDKVYFNQTSGNQYGHTGIYAGNGQFISATPGGVKQMNLHDWVSQYGNSVLGYIPN